MCNLAASGLHRTTFPFAWKHAEAVNNDLGTAPDYLSPNFKTDGSECLADNHRTYGSRCFILQHAVNKPSTNLQPSGHCGRWVGNERNHLTKHHVLDEVTGVISQYGTGDIKFDEFNTQAHIPNQDAAEQLAFLDEIDSTAPEPTLQLPSIESTEQTNTAAATYFCSTYESPFVLPAGCYQVFHVCIFHLSTCLKLCFASSHHI